MGISAENPREDDDEDRLPVQSSPALLEDVVIAAFLLPLRELDHGLGVENDLGSAVIKRRALTILNESRRQYA